MKDVSVVVAVQDAEGTLGDCLSSLTRQEQGGAAEIIVVDNSHGRATATVEQRYPDVRRVDVPGRALVPELWARGAVTAQGSIVAFTTAHFVPASDWVAQIRRHHELGYAAVGGAIENGRRSTAVQWAVYFCRYAAYMPPFAAHTADQIAGDNASYQRWIVETYADPAGSGFWEHAVNARLRQDGHTLLLTPGLRVTYACAPGAWQFCRQRFVHGRIFGAQRAASAGRRAAYLAVSWAIPCVFLSKITRRVVANGRHIRPFVRALPLVVLFTLAWAAGETLGYLRGWTSRGEVSAIAPRAVQ